MTVYAIHAREPLIVISVHTPNPIITRMCKQCVPGTLSPPPPPHLGTRLDQYSSIHVLPNQTA